MSVFLSPERSAFSVSAAPESRGQALLDFLASQQKRICWKQLVLKYFTLIACHCIVVCAESKTTLQPWQAKLHNNLRLGIHLAWLLKPRSDSVDRQSVLSPVYFLLPHPCVTSFICEIRCLNQKLQHKAT